MSPRAVARRFVEAINGEHAEWEFDPQATERLHGSGLTEEGVRSMIGETIQRGGVAALCVDDKPDLRARLVAFAGLRGGTSLPDS
jgi:hypothetical protein